MPRKPAPQTADDQTQPTVMVGANLPPLYARKLARLHADTGRTKKALQQEALDLLFAEYQRREARQEAERA